MLHVSLSPRLFLPVPVREIRHVERYLRVKIQAVADVACAAIVYQPHRSSRCMRSHLHMPAGVPRARVAVNGGVLWCTMVCMQHARWLQVRR